MEKQKIGAFARALKNNIYAMTDGEIVRWAARSQTGALWLKNLNLEEAPLDPLLDSDPSIADVVAASDLIVNTTPVGMAQHGEAGAMPLGESLWSGIKTEATFYDLIYTPRPTAWRRRQGHRPGRNAFTRFLWARSMGSDLGEVRDEIRE